MLRAERLSRGCCHLYCEFYPAVPFLPFGRRTAGRLSLAGHYLISLLNTFPSFITNSTRSSSLMFASGSPPTATTSA